MSRREDFTNYSDQDLIDFILNVPKLPSTDELEQILKTVYRNICGDEAYNIFENITLARLKLLYGMDPKKFGVKGADIISEAGDQQVNNLAKYLERIIPQEEMEFLLKNRLHITVQLTTLAEKAIESGFVKPRYRFQREISYKENIAALLIRGSYAWGSFDRDSDLDVLYVTRDGTDRLTDYFSDALKEMSPFHPRIEHIDLPIKPQRLPKYFTSGKFILATPFLDVSNKLLWS